MMYLSSKLIPHGTKSVQECLGNLPERFSLKKYQKTTFQQIFSKFDQVELQNRRLQELLKIHDFEGFCENSKNLIKLIYRLPDHFVRSSMVLKVSTSILAQVPKQ